LSAVAAVLGITEMPAAVALEHLLWQQTLRSPQDQLLI
jgi:hypothetical protein